MPPKVRDEQSDERSDSSKQSKSEGSHGMGKKFKVEFSTKSGKKICFGANKHHV